MKPPFLGLHLCLKTQPEIISDAGQVIFYDVRSAAAALKVAAKKIHGDMHGRFMGI